MPSQPSPSDPPPASRKNVSPFLFGVAGSAVLWTVTFGLVDPRPRTAGFDWAGVFVFGALTLGAILLVFLRFEEFAFRALLSSLATAALFWNEAVPSTTDGFARAHWVTIALLAVASLSLVLGVASVFDKLQNRGSQ